MSGPYIQLATFCEKVLQEADGILSLIRVVDRINVTAHGSELPSELPAGRMKLTLVVAMKPGDALGRHEATVAIEEPSGRKLPTRAFDVFFEGGDRGVNLIVALELEPIEGLYWFAFSVGDIELTRVPLRITYQRVASDE